MEFGPSKIDGHGIGAVSLYKFVMSHVFVYTYILYISFFKSLGIYFYYSTFLYFYLTWALKCTQDLQGGGGVFYPLLIYTLEA